MRDVDAKEPTMKSVTMSEIVRAHDRARLLFPIQSWRQFAAFAATLALGLPAIMVGVHLLDPAAPLAYIVIPVLLGGLLPAFAVLPGRFEVRTRFDAQHMVGTLDHTLGTLGYAQADAEAGALRYRARKASWFSSGAQDIAVTLRDRQLEIVGPIATLRMLQRRMVV
jgi:hypothetical protein